MQNGFKNRESGKDFCCVYPWRVSFRVCVQLCVCCRCLIKGKLCAFSPSFNRFDLVKTCEPQPLTTVWSESFNLSPGFLPLVSPSYTNDSHSHYVTIQALLPYLNAHHTLVDQWPHQRVWLWMYSTECTVQWSAGVHYWVWMCAVEEFQSRVSVSCMCVDVCVISACIMTK